MELIRDVLFELVVTSLRSRGLKSNTIRRKLLELRKFIDYFVDKKVEIRDIEAKDIEEYLLSIVSSNGSRITAKALIRDLFDTLYNNQLILINPLNKMDLMIRDKAGVRKVFTEDQVLQVLDSIETITAFGIRDRAIFELMYIAGLRIGEVINLNIDDIDFSLKEVFIRDGKNSKDRVVPLGSIAEVYIHLWLKKGRKGVDVNHKALFLNFSYQSLKSDMVRRSFKKYLKLADLDDKGLKKLHKTYHPREN